MAVTTSAKRGEARGAASPPSHIKREVIGVVLIALALLTLLSLLSFVSSEVKAGTSATPPSRNLIGAVGAFFASTIFWTIGAAGYMFPILLGLMGVRCFTQDNLSIRLRNAAASLAALLFLAGFLHLEVTGVPTVSSGLIYRGMAGGIFGRVLAESLRIYFASTGAHILIMAGLLVSLLFTTSISLAKVAQRIPGLGNWMFNRARALIPDRPEEEAASEPLRKAKQRSSKSIREVIEEALPEAAGEPELDWPVIQPSRQPTSEPVEPVESEPEPQIVAAQARAGDYILPDPALLLSEPSGPLGRVTEDEIKAQSDVLTRALLSFGIAGKVTEVRPGPVVTMYEFEPASGTKVARIVNLADDLALALKAISLRIVAPIPGKSVVGIEVPNLYRETVSMREVVTSEVFSRARSKLSLALGKDIFGAPMIADLKTMPHLLVAGATGAGKSVSLNTMLLSLLFSARPNEVKLLLIDPKMLEFQTYDGIPHLLRPVITDPKSAARGLSWVVAEMERRYKLLAEAGVRNIDAYNRKVSGGQGISEVDSAAKLEQPELPIQFLPEEERLSAGETTLPDGSPGSFLPPPTPPEPLPYIVVMIDELADLMMVAPKEVEDKIARLAQMARASGIHLVLATQRPSVDVLTGLIKANFPARIAFQVSSKTDSRTILDANGAEALLGRGDMLYLASGTGRLMRGHGSFVSDDDVRRVVEFVKDQARPAYNQELQTALKQEEAKEEEALDEVYEQAKELVLTTGQASASLIQRRLRVGYPRAARMIEQMEADGLVGAAGRDGRREIVGRRGPVGAEEQA
ncbi:MAG: DNA translocase FtsK 4TM domain-containing protein [Nitrospirae bacterium]|nr:DNA translocase FtsK 4TM domain-containing protein [Nitrospirota bacterium]